MAFGAHSKVLEGGHCNGLSLNLTLCTGLSNTEKTFRANVGSALSSVRVHENGVLLGGVLSCTLFIVKMDSLGKAPTISYSVHVTTSRYF